jgi:hypothetical protein
MYRATNNALEIYNFIVMEIGTTKGRKSEFRGNSGFNLEVWIIKKNITHS